MKIHKVINNNFVIVSEDCEKILMGMGIGFQKRPGDLVDESKILKIFYLSSDEITAEVYKVLNKTSIETVNIVEHTISDYKKETKKNLNNTIHLSLIDHLNNTISNFRKGISLTNTFLFDIKRFYPDEFKYAKEMVEEINAEYEILLPDDEAGFIALHFVAANLNEDANMIWITKVIKEITALVSRYFNVQYDENSVYYYRFVMHLKYFAQRAANGKLQAADSSSSELFSTITRLYPDIYDCVIRIHSFLQKTYQIEISKEEQLYLILHIHKVIHKSE